MKHHLKTALSHKCFSWGRTGTAGRGKIAIPMHENITYKLESAVKKVNIVLAAVNSKMVRNYKRLSGRKKWSQSSLATAIDAVISHRMSMNRAAIAHGIPRQTLSRHLRLR